MAEYFYVASSVRNIHNVRACIRLIEDNTLLKCSYDWTQEIVDPSIVDLKYQRKLITWELDGVGNSDLVIMLPPCGRGAHVELGYALALDIPVIMVGQSEDPAMAYALVKQVQDISELMQVLKNYEEVD